MPEVIACPAKAMKAKGQLMKKIIVRNEFIVEEFTSTFNFVILLLLLYLVAIFFAEEATKCCNSQWQQGLKNI